MILQKYWVFKMIFFLLTCLLSSKIHEQAIYSVSLICVVYVCSLSSLASQYQVYHMKTSSNGVRTFPSLLTERIVVKWPRYCRYDVKHQPINQSINESINQFNSIQSINQFNQSINQLGGSEVYGLCARQSIYDKLTHV